MVCLCPGVRVRLCEAVPETAPVFESTIGSLNMQQCESHARMSMVTASTNLQVSSMANKIYSILGVAKLTYIFVVP